MMQNFLVTADTGIKDLPVVLRGYLDGIRQIVKL